MKRRLAAAILGTFASDDAAPHRDRLSAFREESWKTTHRWLDASGLALYFGARIHALAIEDAVPHSVRRRLHENCLENRSRMQDLIAEFISLNDAFASHNLAYFNLKGFSLTPDYCPDAALRFQIDLDFVIDAKDAVRGQRVLEDRGYRLTAAGEQHWEFKTCAAEMPSLRDLYRAKPQRSVEVRIMPFKNEAVNGRHLKTQTRSIGGYRFPALADPDQFLWQSAHLAKHLGGEWTRTSWLLELFRFIRTRYADDALWQKVRETAERDEEMRASVGLSVFLASRVFGEFAPAALTAWSVDRLHASSLLWAERYGHEILMAPFPGTKRYLLMPAEIAGANLKSNSSRRSRLLPFHAAPRIVFGESHETGAQRIRRLLAQWWYVLLRAKFHIGQGLWYLQEAPRWKRLLAQMRKRQSAIGQAEPLPQ